MTKARHWISSRTRRALCLVALCVLPAQRGWAQEVSARDVGTLLRDNQSLRRQVELASSNSFYLVIDPGARSLSLKLHGVVLGRFGILRVEVAERQVAWISRTDEGEWRERIWTAGKLDPPRARDRIELKAPPPGTDASEEPPYVPPPPEEAFPVPPRYGIRFAGGLFIEIHSAEGEAAPSFGARVQHWWADFKEALRSEPSDRVRLRVTLKHEDVQALYRSLPPDCSLLVLSAR